MREFTSKPAEEPSSFQFGLDGEVFTAALRQDANAVLEWSAIANASADSQAGLDTAEGAALIARFFQLFLNAAEYRRFRQHLVGRDPAILGEIMTSINEMMENLVERVADRPTKPPSRSSAGRGAKDERTLQIISLPEGEVEWADSPAGKAPQQQRRQQGRAQRRRKTG